MLVSGVGLLVDVVEAGGGDGVTGVDVAGAALVDVTTAALVDVTRVGVVS